MGFFLHIPFPDLTSLKNFPEIPNPEVIAWSST